MLPEAAVLNPSPSMAPALSTALDEWETAQSTLLDAISRKKPDAVLAPLRAGLQSKREALHTASVSATPAMFQSLYQFKSPEKMTRQEFFAAWSYYQRLMTETALRHKLPGVALDTAGIRQFLGITENEQLAGEQWLAKENEKKDGAKPDVIHPYDYMHVAAIKAAKAKGKDIPANVSSGYIDLGI